MCFFSFALAMDATPPNPESFDTAFDRFATTYIQQCEEIMRELPVNYAEREKDFEVLSGYLNNVRADDISGIRRCLKGDVNDTRDMRFWLRGLNTDIIGFRRVLDQLIIINLANNKLRLGEELQEKLKKYWKDERYYSWRFGYEADMIDLAKAGEKKAKSSSTNPAH
jgi:hypothetical protein